MSLSFLIADSLHINERNFTSFIKFIKQNKFKIHFEDSQKEWIALYGIYDKKLDVLYDKIELLSKLSENELFKFSVYDINLFFICRAEIMSLVSTKQEWYDCQYPSSMHAMFSKLFKTNRAELLQNMSAAWHWVEFWKLRLSDLPSFSYCCVFSGSLIYQKALIEQLKFTPTKVIVMESLFTGNEYYCEEKYSHIANNSDIKFKAIYSNYINNLESGNDYDKERVKAINKILLSKNKNVEQPTASEILKFSNSELPCVCIIAQVINDFSVLEYKNIGLSTIAFYKELLYKLASSGFNVVIKTHPWEEKKNNVKTPLTKNILSDFVRELPEQLQERIIIVDHYSIKQLFGQVKWIMGLNSQALIEAAFEGFKPIQFGDAFYGNKGFTSDYQIDEIDKCVKDIQKGDINGSLTLDEFNAFETFITILLQKHAVCIHDSGLAQLRKIFAPIAYVPLVTQTTAREEAPKKQPDSKLSQSVSTQVAVSPTSKAISTDNKVKTTIIIETNEVDQENKNKKHSNFDKKMNKFKNNPRKFFSDSKNPALRIFRHFFKNKT